MEDLIQVIFGWYLLELLGAIIRYLIINLINKTKGVKLKKFSFFSERKQDVINDIDNTASNRIVGAVFLILLLVLFLI